MKGGSGTRFWRGNVADSRPSRRGRIAARLTRLGEPANRVAEAQAAYDAGRFDDVLALLEAAGDAPEAWRLRSLAAFRSGDMAAAADAAAALLAGTDPSAEAQRGPRFDVLAVAVVACGELARYDAMLAQVREMLGLAARSGGLPEYVRARGTAANAFALLGDPWAAQRLLGELAGLFQGGNGPAALEATVRGNHASVCLAVARLAAGGGDEAAAAEALDHAAASIARSREIAAAAGDSRIAAFADVHEAELALLRGRGAEAQGALAGAIAQAEARRLHAHARQLRLLDAEILLAAGEARAAQAQLERLAAMLGPQHELSVRIRSAALLHDVLLALEDPLGARVHLAAARTLETARLYHQLRAQSQFLRTRLELEHLYRYRDGAPR